MKLIPESQLDRDLEIDNEIPGHSNKDIACVLLNYVKQTKRNMILNEFMKTTAKTTALVRRVSENPIHLHDIFEQHPLAAQQYQQQMGLAQAAPQLAGKQISALTTLGGLGQSQLQAQLSAQQQLAQQQLYQPLSTAQQYGSGIMGLISGYPGGMQSQQVPVPGIAQTAIGAGTTLAGIYGAMTR